MSYQFTGCNTLPNSMKENGWCFLLSCDSSKVKLLGTDTFSQKKLDGPSRGIPYQSDLTNSYDIWNVTNSETNVEDFTIFYLLEWHMIGT